MTATPAQPHVIIVAGPNGAGKSTSAPRLLRDALAVVEFVNADAIAVGLSAFKPESVAIAAGRLMLERMRQLAAARANFAFETTLASRSFAPWITGLRRHGYCAHLLFLRLESEDLAVNRVAERVRMGGHDVPEEIIRRRYKRGLNNFFGLYQPVMNSWQLFDNSSTLGPRLIASGEGKSARLIEDAATWRELKEAYND
jgi:predicted ABC-type ATPase